MENLIKEYEEKVDAIKRELTFGNKDEEANDKLRLERNCYQQFIYELRMLQTKHYV